MIPRQPAIAALVLLVACWHAPPGDQDRYLDVLQAEGSPDPEGQLATCAAIEEQGLRGDCGLVVSRRVIGSRSGEAARWCPEVEEGRWRDECWFKAAEDAQHQGAIEVARERCARAGSFRSECEFHLVQAELVEAARGEASRDLTVIDARFDELVDGRLDLGSPATLRTRRTWFKLVFEAQGLSEAPDCGVLTDPGRQQACAEASQQALRRGQGAPPSPQGAPGVAPGSPSGPPPAAR